MLLAWTWGCTAREAMERCSYREFQLWRAFYRLNPWGPEAEDVRWARLTACGSGGNVADYLLGWKPRVQTGGSIRSTLMEMVAAGFGKLEKGSDSGDGRKNGSGPDDEDGGV